MTEYTITVPCAVKEITLSARDSSNLIIDEGEWKSGSISYTTEPVYKEIVAVTGRIALSVGENSVHITASHTNGVGTDVRYTVRIIREAGVHAVDTEVWGGTITPGRTDIPSKEEIGRAHV